MPPSIVDIGLNLTHDSFDHDRDTVVAAAEAAGVTHMVITGSTLESSRAAVALARSRRDVGWILHLAKIRVIEIHVITVLDVLE